MNAPIDNVHAECTTIIHNIRRRVTALKDHAATWQPGPAPAEWLDMSQPIPERHSRRSTPTPRREP